MATYCDKFGSFLLDAPIEFDSGTIRPLPNYREAKTWIDSNTHRDGYLYPSQSWHIKNSGEEVPRTRRPQHLFALPSTHEMRLSVVGDTEAMRRADAGFLLHLVGFLHDVRLQFWNWFVDMRVRVKGHPDFFPHPTVVADCISRCYASWKRLSPADRFRITNALYLWCRAPGYEWDWERFLIEYMILDACWPLACEKHGLDRRLSHKKKAETMCRTLEIPWSEEHGQRIVGLRNDLVHEAIWDQGQPGTARSAEAFLTPFHIHRLTQRLILALLDYRNSFVQST